MALFGVTEEHPRFESAETGALMVYEVMALVRAFLTAKPKRK